MVKVEKEVSEYFKDSPFATFAGKLAFNVGEEDFVTLKGHEELLTQLKQNLIQSNITIRLLVSVVGGGKTWTLSWLYRQFSKREHALVICVPRLELRGQPERELTEAIFRGVLPELKKIRGKLGRKKMPKEFHGTVTEYVWNAILDTGAFSTLSGGGGRLPTLNNARPPSLRKTEGTMQLLLGLFRVLYFVDYAEIIVLTDEVESLFVAYGRKDLFIFENYLRGLHDEFQSGQGKRLPRVLILLAATSSVLEQISPILVQKQTGASDFASALARRLGPMVLLVTDESEALRIAEHRINEHRRQRLDQPYIPYDKDAILLAWRSSLGNIGDFCKYLQQMYELALAERANRITLKEAKRVVEQYVPSTPSEG